MKPSTGVATSACCIGTGRMGRAIVHAARRAGMDVVGSWSRSSTTPLEAVLADVDVVFVAVPDDAVGAVTALLGRHGSAGQLVLVTSGAARIEALAAAAPALRVARLHPMQAVGADAREDVLDGAVAAITALDGSTAEAAHEVARRLAMRGFDLADGAAATWHAAGTVAAGGVVATLAAARDLAVAAGLDAELALVAVGALAASAVDQARETSPERAITGPVARGDRTTVQSHRAAIIEVAPSLLDLYDVLAARVAHVAGGASVTGPAR